MTDGATRPLDGVPFDGVPLDAVLLAGGRASRLDGVSKPDLAVGGRSLLQHAQEAARAAGADRIVVVGPPSLEAPGCIVVREDPPFGGPVAAIAAGLAALDPPSGPRSRDSAGPEASDVLVLACDLPNAGAVATRLRAHRGERGDGVCLVDADGRAQWLAAVYRRPALDRAFAALDRAVDGASMRHLVAALDLIEVDDGGTAADVDTWDDLERARARTGHPPAPDPAGDADRTDPDRTDPSRSTP